MLAHKVYGEHPAWYSWPAPSSLKVGKMGRSQRSSTPEDHYNWRIKCNLFSDIGELVPSQKLKGSHTFTAWSATVESNEAAEDSGMKAKEEEEAESSAGEDSEPQVELGGDQSFGYTVCFANVVKLYQRKIEIVLDVVVLTISWKIVWRILARPPEKQV